MGGWLCSPRSSSLLPLYPVPPLTTFPPSSSSLSCAPSLTLFHSLLAPDLSPSPLVSFCFLPSPIAPSHSFPLPPPGSSVTPMIPFVLNISHSHAPSLPIVLPRSILRFPSVILPPFICPLSPITKHTTAVFVVYILQIHLPRRFSPTKKPVLLRLQYHDYFYHSHSKKYHSSNRSIIFIPHFMIKLLW